MWGRAGCWDREGTWAGTLVTRKQWGPTTHAVGFSASSFDRSREVLLWNSEVVCQCQLWSPVSVSPTSCSQVPTGTHTGFVTTVIRPELGEREK